MSSLRFIATSLKEAAAVFGVQQETIRAWIARGCPAEVGTSPEGGRYDIPEMIRWARKNVWVPKQNGSGGSGSSEAELRTKILEIEYTDKALSLKQRLGQLVLKEAVLSHVTRQYSSIRNRLEAIPNEAAANVSAPLRAETIETWKRMIHSLLTELEQTRYE